MGRQSNEDKNAQVDALVAKGMDRAEVEALSAAERAELLGEKVDPALIEGEKRTVEQADQDLSTAQAELEELKRQLAEATEKNERELAAAKAEATNIASENESLRNHLATVESDFREGRVRKSAGEIRVKTPMLINPVPPRDYDPAEDGPLPAAYPLQKGLNVDVPAWVVNTFIVQANLEDEPAQA